MKPLIIYHANCADGFGAAFAAWLKFGDEAEYKAVKYGELDLKEGESYDRLINYHDGHVFGVHNLNREFYILDFSFSKETMSHLFAKAKRIIWLDHHKTAFEMWADVTIEQQQDTQRKHYINLDNNKSGALLAWEYFHPDTEVPMLIKHIDDYDRWQFKLAGTKEFNKALWSYAPWSFEQWKKKFLWLGYNGGDETKREVLLAEGAAILRAHDANVQAVVKGAARKCVIVTDNPTAGFTAFTGFAANCPPHLASDVGHELANQSGTYGLLWHINNEGKCLCSLRSNGDYDVSAIAKAFGGGGHKNAAGFETDIETLVRWLHATD